VFPDLSIKQEIKNKHALMGERRGAPLGSGILQRVGKAGLIDRGLYADMKLKIRSTGVKKGSSGVTLNVACDVIVVQTRRRIAHRRRLNLPTVPLFRLSLENHVDPSWILRQPEYAFLEEIMNMSYFVHDYFDRGLTLSKLIRVKALGFSETVGRVKGTVRGGLLNGTKPTSSTEFNNVIVNLDAQAEPEYLQVRACVRARVLFINIT